jgi:hypothetical protein
VSQYVAQETQTLMRNYRAKRLEEQLLQEWKNEVAERIAEQAAPRSYKDQVMGYTAKDLLDVDDPNDPTSNDNSTPTDKNPATSNVKPKPKRLKTSNKPGAKARNGLTWVKQI